MKKALATIDCVVVGVEVGHGKRHGVLSDYTFAVRDEATGTLVTIGKAYSGLTDAEIAEMTAGSRPAHARAVRRATGWSSRPSSSRSRSTSSSGRPAIDRAFRSAFRGSPGSGPTRPSDEIDTVAGVEANLAWAPARRRAPGDCARQESPKT